MKTFKRNLVIVFLVIAFLVIAFLVLFTQVEPTKIKNSLIEDNLLGKVSAITVKRYSAQEKFGEILKGNYDGKSVYRYNKNGEKTEYNSYKSDDSLKDTEIYKFEGNGRATELETYYLGILDKTFKLKYNEKGNITEKNEYKSDGSLSSKEIYKFEGNGEATERNIYRSDGSLFTRHIYRYDEKGRKIEQHGGRVPEDSDSSIITWVYDENGDILSTSLLWGTLQNKTTFLYNEYDKTGNWIKRTADYGNETYIEDREIEYY